MPHQVAECVQQGSNTDFVHAGSDHHRDEIAGPNGAAQAADDFLIAQVAVFEIFFQKVIFTLGGCFHQRHVGFFSLGFEFFRDFHAGFTLALIGLHG